MFRPTVSVAKLGQGTSRDHRGAAVAGGRPRCGGQVGSKRLKRVAADEHESKEMALAITQNMRAERMREVQSNVSGNLWFSRPALVLTASFTWLSGGGSAGTAGYGSPRPRMQLWVSKPAAWLEPLPTGQRL